MKLFISFILCVLILASCSSKSPIQNEIQETPFTKVDTQSQNNDDTTHLPNSNLTQGAKNDKSAQLPDPSKLDFISYYDKKNNITLSYPKSWSIEKNAKVPFKITSPRDYESDSMLENFYYVVFDETPPAFDLLQKEKLPTLTLEQMNQNVLTDIKIQKPNRKNVKIISNKKVQINGVDAYETISTGTINGFEMMYRICAIKKENKQCYLFFAAEAYNYNIYIPYANLLFNSFLIK